VAVDQLVSLTKRINNVELSRAKNMLKTSMFINLESRQILADDLGRQLTIFGKRYSPHELVSKIDQITVPDVQNLVRRILSSPPTVVYLGHSDEIKRMPPYEKLVNHFRKYVK